VIEQNDFSGKVTARLRIVPGASAGEFQFEVEDLKPSIPVRAIGIGKISNTEVRVQIIERASGTTLAFRGQTHQVTLSLDRLSFNFILDERVRELMEELRRRVTSGADDAQLIGLAMDLDRALKIRTGYKPFLQRVKDSPAFDILMVAKSLIGAVSHEEAKQNIALAAIHSALRFLAPSPISLGASLSGNANSTWIERGQGVNGMIFRKTLAYALLTPKLIKPQSCTTQFFDTLQNTCAPLSTLLEVLCITMASIEWLICMLT